VASNILKFIAFSVIAAIPYYFFRRSCRKYILLASSIVFYLCITTSWGGGLVFLGEVILSYYLSKILARYRSKILLAVCVIPSVMLLGFTKYYYFLPSGLLSPDTARFIIPFGISFYTLRIISYHADIYTGKITVLPSLSDYVLYVSMFTQIISGPVMRMDDFVRQADRAEFDSERAKSGLFMILDGLFRKLVIAEMSSGYVNAVHKNIAVRPALCLWMAAFLYAVELYADFSGYSAISNGIMKIFGFDVPDNFSTPYFSRGFGDFWRRWHISFSSWLRDYVYIPLGGSRCSGLRHFVNVMITFTVSGMWHGSGMNFLFWGMLHGLLVWLSARSRVLRNSLVTFILVMLLWIPFRAADMTSALTYYAHMFADFEVSMSTVTAMVLLFTGDNTCVIVACVLFASIIFMLLYDIAVRFGKDYSATFTFIFSVMIILFGTVGESAFIYAQF